jgi:CubicO group peptidase (beta-lactamase class C family)
VSRSWNRAEVWIALVVVAVGAVLTVILGIFMFMTVTVTRLHPEPDRVPSVSGSDQAGQWREAIERGRQIVRAALSERNLPGLSVAVGSGGDVVWAEGFGLADLDSRTPVTPDTRFKIGTASTALTAAAVGLLLEKKQLQLDDEIQNHVPEFPKKAWPVTLRHLLGHTAGVRTDGGDEGPLFSQHCERPVDALRFFADRALLFEPGTQYRFSSYGWIVVSAAVESAAGEPFFRFMRTRVFEPLGMSGTTADSAMEPIANRATPYFPRFAADPGYGLHLMRPIDTSCYAGAGAFLSTPSDLVRFGNALMGGTLLQPVTIQLLQSPQRLPTGEETGYGLGWDLENVTLAGKTTRVVGHDGDVLGGMVASLLTIPDRRLVVAVTSNISYADTFSIASSIAEAFAERTPAGIP